MGPLDFSRQPQDISKWDMRWKSMSFGGLSSPPIHLYRKKANPSAPFIETYSDWLCSWTNFTKRTRRFSRYCRLLKMLITTDHPKRSSAALWNPPFNAPQLAIEATIGNCTFQPISRYPSFVHRLCPLRHRDNSTTYTTSLPCAIFRFKQKSCIYFEQDRRVLHEGDDAGEGHDVVWQPMDGLRNAKRTRKISRLCSLAYDRENMRRSLSCAVVVVLCYNYVWFTHVGLTQLITNSWSCQAVGVMRKHHHAKQISKSGLDG